MRRALVPFLFLVCGCAELAKDQTVCPEYRGLRCPAGSTCSMDAPRGCRVCQCNPINTMQAPGGGPDSNTPPPVVIPEPSR